MVDYERRESKALISRWTAGRLMPVLALMAMSVVSSGCSVKPSVPATQLSSLLPEGSLSLTRTAPLAVFPDASVNREAGETVVGNSTVPMVGLVPGAVPALLSPKIEPAGAWLSIDIASRTVSLIDSGEVVFSAPFSGDVGTNNGGDGLSVLLKQRNAVWFAPDEYFAARGLEVPAENSRERYLKGALGDFVVYLDEDMALYSGPVDVPEIAGVRLDPNDLARIYYLLPVGAKAETR
jgi:hypothetical protein